MQVLVLSDIHGAVEPLQRILSRESADLILVLGDITDTGIDDYADRAQQILTLLDDQGTFVKAVPGNMDDETVLRLLIEHRMNLHKNIFSMEDYDFLGFGGGSSPFDTPFEPDDAERGDVLQQLLQRTTATHRAIISHQPPKHTGIDRTSEGTAAGSAALRDLIQQQDVDLVLSGHIHEARGQDELNGAVLVNPGPVKDGQYAVLQLADEIAVELPD